MLDDQPLSPCSGGQRGCVTDSQPHRPPRVDLDPASSLDIQASTATPGTPDVSCLQAEGALSFAILLLAVLSCSSCTLRGQGLSGRI